MPTESLESSERALLLDRLLAALGFAFTLASELFPRRFGRDGARPDVSGGPPHCVSSDHCGSDGAAGTDVGAGGSCSMRSAVTEGTLFFSLQGALILACIRAAIQYRRLSRILPTLVSCSQTAGPTALPVFVVALVSGVYADTPPRARPWQIAPESYLSLRTVAPDARPEAQVIEYMCSVLFKKRAATQLFMTHVLVLHERVDHPVYLRCKLLNLRVQEHGEWFAVVLCDEPQPPDVPLGVFCLNVGKPKQIMFFWFGWHVILALFVLVALDASMENVVRVDRYPLRGTGGIWLEIRSAVEPLRYRFGASGD
ncbi:stomatin family protein [Alternaria alternata]|nr:stomatin family protein [Alternaria alternata]